MTTQEITTGSVTPAIAWWLARMVKQARPDVGASLRILEGYDGEHTRLYLVHTVEGYNALKLRKMGRKRAWHYAPGLEKLREELHRKVL